MACLPTDSRVTFIAMNQTEPDERPIDPKEFKALDDYAYEAHQNHCTKTKLHSAAVATMRQDDRVPFVTHPLWAALTLLLGSSCY